MVISFRRCKKKDLYKVIDINERCLPENYDPRTWRELLTNSPCSYVATIGKIIIGYIITTRLDTEYNTHKNINITSLAVLPEYRRQGIANKLLTAVLTEISNLQCTRCSKSCHCAIDLCVRVGNKPAQELYKKFGFQVDRTITGYYINPDEDAYLLCLQRRQ